MVGMRHQAWIDQGVGLYDHWPHMARYSQTTTERGRQMTHVIQPGMGSVNGGWGGGAYDMARDEDSLGPGYWGREEVEGSYSIAPGQGAIAG